SYDYLGAYTTQPLVYPHPSRPVPHLPIMWDTALRATAVKPPGLARLDDTRDRYDYPTVWNHIPGGSNVLWMDGTVTFVEAQSFVENNLPAPVEGYEYMPPGQAELAPEEQRQR
ncbi:MAG: hypothetical protein HYZ00_12855, partial [Candidatus Hydrogenedentes bacterium]|nr:hypothetical protein [Candidatus Hydrogenedentota bacterium]